MACLCTLRRLQAARVPKKVPAAVNAQIVMVTAVSLVVIMRGSRLKQNGTVPTIAPIPPDYLDAGQDSMFSPCTADLPRFPPLFFPVQVV